MQSTGISSIDITIVILYFIIVLGIGLFIARKTKTGEELFLGGRSFTWGLIGLSLFASNISSSTIIALSGKAYSTGVVQSVYEWMSGLPLLVAAVIFIPLYLRSRITTIPEFLQYRFDYRSRNYFSAMTIFMSVVIEMSGGLYAGALVLQHFFPDLILWQATMLLAFVAGVYTAFGGLKAVVYTDAIQAVILIIGCSALTYLLFAEMDFSWSAVVASVPEGHLSMVRPLDDPDLPWLGLLVGVPFMGFWYWSTNQFIVQRILGAQDIKHARWGVLLAGFLKVIPLFIMVIPGVMAISVLPGLEDPDKVFPTAMTEILPVGLLGLVLAGLISAIMSSVDSTLNSASTLLVVDFIEPRMSNASEVQIANYGRITTLVLTIIAAIWAPQIANFQSLWDYLQQMFSIVVPPIAVIFLVGVFFKRGNGDGAFWTLVLGTSCGLALFFLEQYDLWHLHYTINVGLMIATSTLIFIVVSYLTPAPPAEKIEAFTYRPELVSAGMEGLPWYQDYRFHSVLLVLLMAAILIGFW
ncbi:MAG: sodium:solute symporter [Bacteroidota bacterium]